MFQTYKIVFKKLGVHSVELEKFVAGHLNEASVCVRRRGLALVMLLKEVVGLEMPLRSSLVALVKKRVGENAVKMRKRNSCVEVGIYKVDDKAVL